jgi:hypothetical protein
VLFRTRGAGGHAYSRFMKIMMTLAHPVYLRDEQGLYLVHLKDNVKSDE